MALQKENIKQNIIELIKKLNASALSNQDEAVDAFADEWSDFLIETIQEKDNSLIFSDILDVTKQLEFDLSDITSGSKSVIKWKDGNYTPASDQDLKIEKQNRINGDLVLENKSIPSGGSTGQFLRKFNNQDYKTEWVTPNFGTVIKFFQVQDDGTTGFTLNSGSFVALNNIWDTPSLTSSDFTFNSSSGTLTMNSEGVLELEFKVLSFQTTVNNRAETKLEILKNGSRIVFEAQYSSRSNSINAGGAYIHGFKIQCLANDVFTFRVARAGVSTTIGTGEVANSTYIGAKLYM